MGLTETVTHLESGLVNSSLAEGAPPTSQGVQEHLHGQLPVQESQEECLQFMHHVVAGDEGCAGGPSKL